MIRCLYGSFLLLFALTSGATALSGTTSHSDATSFDDACRSMPATPLITVSALPVSVENSILGGDIRAMTINTTGVDSLGKRSTVGTTLAHRILEISYAARMVRDPASQRVCYRPAIGVVIGYEPLQISVAQPFHSGSCAYEAILEHERQHVKIYSEFVPAAARSIEQQVRDAIPDTVRYAANVQAMNADIQRTLHTKVQAIARQELAKGQQRHAGFDSIEESLRLLNSCNGELRRGLSGEVLAGRDAGRTAERFAPLID